MSQGFEADERDMGRRLIAACMDRWPLTPEAVLRREIKAGSIRVNDDVVSPRCVLRKGDRVDAEPAAWEGDVAAPEPEVLFADTEVMAVNKPPGCTVVRERWEATCPFQDGVFRWLRERYGPEGVTPRYRPRAVHRIDRDTSGVILIALAPESERTLFQQFRGRTILKEYLALVLGAPSEPMGELDAPIEEHPIDKTRMQIAHRGGKHSLTLYEVVERFRGHALVRCFPRTGRRHQIRLHLAHAGAPVAGDALYGGGEGLFLSAIKRGFRPKPDRPEPPLIGRMALHAAAIEFTHTSGRTVRVEAPLPNDFARVLKALRKWSQP